ncbi:MAG: YceI family protein [Pseudomonadota bacterium]
MIVIARSVLSVGAWPVIVMAALALSARPAFAERYEIDPTETKTTYETKYLGFISVRGVFERMTGALRYDFTKPPAERDAFIQVTIDTTTMRPTTLNTDAMREWLRGPAFFNVEKFPTIEFKSTLFRFEGNKLFAIDGALSLTGVTKPVTLIVNKSGCEPAVLPRQARCTASVEIVVNRSEYGMSGWGTTVSDEVKIAVELVAVAVPAAKALPNISVPADGSEKRATESPVVPPPNAPSEK